MADESISTDMRFLDPPFLFKMLLPRLLPGRVERLLHDGERGFVKILIPAVYPDGQPIDSVYCGYLSGAEKGDLVFVEWEDAPGREREKRHQPNLIQASVAIPADEGEIQLAIEQYKALVATELRQKLQETLNKLEEELNELEEEKKRVARSVDERVSRELERRGAQLEARERELDQREARLDEREKELNQTIARRVEEITAERQLELDVREALLQRREADLMAAESALNDERLKLEARWQALARDRAQFEAEGGPAFIDYLKRIEAEDKSKAPDRLEPASEPFDPGRLADTLAERGYHISADMLAQAVIATVAAWASGQFVILAGPTGVGKTQLVKQLAELLGAGYGLVPVRPGWVEPSDLFGFFNPMHRLFEPAPALDYLLEARAFTDAGRLYALCLDEMNLSRIENYAADLLSKLELVAADPETAIDLYSVDIEQRLRREQETLLQTKSELDPAQQAYLHALSRQLVRYPRKFHIPRGLVLYGTVNVDETTQMFSPKFLDRAYVLRFPPSALPDRLDQMPFQPGLSQPLWPVTIEKAQELAVPAALPEDFHRVWRTFTEWQAQYLRPLGLHFGYRFYASFRQYVAIALNLGMGDPHKVAQGYFVAKIPPRIRFNPDEHAIGESDRTKIDVLQEWIDRDQALKSLDALRQALIEMIQRSEGRGMVEYWD